MIEAHLTQPETGFSLKELATIVQSIVTTIAIIVGGIWTWILFVKKRHGYPRARLEHRILKKPLPDGKTLLNVQLIISNIGDVLLSIVSTSTRVQQMLPIIMDIKKCIDEGKDPVSEGNTECEWPLLSERLGKISKGEFIVEPGETETICYDFIIDADVQTIAVYSHLENLKENHKNHEIGWNLTTVYDIKEVLC